MSEGTLDKMVDTFVDEALKELYPEDHKCTCNVCGNEGLEVPERVAPEPSPYVPKSEPVPDEYDPICSEPVWECLSHGVVSDSIFHGIKMLHSVNDIKNVVAAYLVCALTQDAPDLVAVTVKMPQLLNDEYGILNLITAREGQYPYHYLSFTLDILLSMDVPTKPEKVAIIEAAIDEAIDQRPDDRTVAVLVV